MDILQDLTIKTDKWISFRINNLQCLSGMVCEGGEGGLDLHFDILTILPLPPILFPFGFA